MPLEKYRDKRDPGRTPEPFGEERPGRALPPGAWRAFVVQQHAARRMHWDLRLEIDGVLVSWAVPKGPSLDPAEKRLAVRTEDHPVEYARFEGVIPEGNYGAGAMIVWDAGSWRTVKRESPAQGLEAGKLDLMLEGHKLRGRFALVRTRSEEGRDWLLLRKGRAPEESGEIVETEPASVLSGLTVEELARGEARDAEVREAAERAGARRAHIPELDGAKLRPMLAETGDEAFSDPRWLFELKYDGVRVLAEKRAEQVRLFARTGAERTRTYPEVARALAHLPVEDCVLDGELVVFDERGAGSFERIQRRFTQTDPAQIARSEVEHPVVLQAFDCLAVAGHDLRRLPLAERKRILSHFVPRLGVVRFADHVEGDGEALFAIAEAHALEGVIAKRADSTYETGRRSRRWLKLKAPHTATLAIVGIVPGKGSRRSLGSLAVAWQRGENLSYAGNVGSGLTEASIESVLARADALACEAPAAASLPEPLPRGVRWLRPELVCEVRYTEVTRAGSLRQPVFLGLRDDVSVADCRAPASLDPASVDPEAAAPDPPASEPAPRLELTRLDKVFWPVEGYTKGDLLAWYEAAWPFLAPYLADRPVVLTRYPDGIEGKHFYQKNAPEFTPHWVKRTEIEGTDYFLCNDLDTLLYVVNSGAIPLHVWSARVGALDRPDWLILDLDPKEAPFAQVVEVARHLHRLLGELGAAHFVKTSGQDGLHVMLPLAGSLDHGEAKALAEALARSVSAELPDVATIARPLAARGRKVYVDYLQNGRGKLIAAPLSVRPRPGAPVSMPLTWRQVTSRLDPARWTIETALARLRHNGDPFLGVLGEGVDLAELLEGLSHRLGPRD